MGGEQILKRDWRVRAFFGKMVHINIFWWRNNKNNQNSVFVTRTSENSYPSLKRKSAQITTMHPSIACTIIYRVRRSIRKSSKQIITRRSHTQLSLTIEDEIRMGNWIEFCTTPNIVKKLGVAVITRNAHTVTTPGNLTTTL